MSNSKLACYTNISPNKSSPRTDTIDTITIHCVVGQLSIETMGYMFAQPDYKASCNYCIGSDGRIGLIVEEKDRSWCSSSRANDNRAITIECASDLTHPYAVNSKVYKSLISLLVDICQRNGIKSLKWKADPSLIGRVDKQNMTVHRWFANKACPGEYLYNKMGEIADDVNLNLGSTPVVSSDYMYKIQCGAFTNKRNAESHAETLKNLGLKARVNRENNLYIVTVGGYKTKSSASKVVNNLAALGYQAYVKIV